MSTNFSIKAIHFGSKEYLEMVDLRRKILRIPLGLDFSEEDLNKDINSGLLASYNSKNEILGCCVIDFNPLESTIKVRQMAVDTHFQNTGIGKQLMLEVEEWAKREKINRIHLHARKIAVTFYQKQGYKVCSNEFTEVSIPHFEMEKRIKSD